MDNNLKNKNKGPVSLLIHGGNELSFGTAKTLLEQGGKVIIVDQFNLRNKEYIKQLKTIGSADFVDFKGLNQLLSNLPNIDYIFYFLHDYLTVSSPFSSKDFLEESNNLNNCLKTARDFSAKFALISTVLLNQELSSHILNSKLSAPLPYSPVELQKYCETLVAEYRDKSKINARIIRVGTIIGKGVEKIGDTSLLSLLEDFSSKTYLSIRGEGLDTHHLVNLNDAVYGVLKLTFSGKTEGEVITLANNREYTTLSLAYKLLELNPDLLEIKFLPQDKRELYYSEHYIPAPNAEEFGWSQKVNLEQSMIDTISTLNPSKAKYLLTRKQSVQEETPRSSNVKTPAGTIFTKIFSPFAVIAQQISGSVKNIKSGFSLGSLLKSITIAIVSIALLYFVFSPLFGLIYGGTSLYFLSKKSYQQITALDFEGASTSMEKAYNTIKRTEDSFAKTRWVFHITNQKESYDNISQLLFASEYALSGAQGMTKALVPLSEYISQFEPAIDFSSNTPKSTRDFRIYLKELQDNSSSISKASYDILLASQLIKNVQVDKLPKMIQSPLVTLKTFNENIIEQISPLEKILTFLPDILGVDSRKTYLILFQNPAELRSTGGWISSYAILGIDGGQIRELKVDDVYNAEGQLRIAGKYFEAPKDMQVALGTTRWSLSLVNWDPDLSQVASSAEYFLSSLEPGTQFDGVITLDTELIKMLLSKWGGLEIPGEVDPITAENLDLKIFQIHSEFKPGESVKTTFLANLANKTIEKLLSGNVTEFQNVASVMLQGLNQKNIQISLKNKKANDFLSQNKWSGQISRENLSAPIPVEWNWGANKANMYLERNSSLNITIENKETITYDFEVFVKNKSTSNIYPQGNYENYFRIFLPQNASISSIKGYKGNQYTVTNQGRYKVVGGWFNTPIRSTQAFEIKYKLTNDSLNYFPITTTSSEYIMNLDIFKQAGTFDDVYDIKINYPDSWSLSLADGFDRTLNTLTTRGVLKTPLSYQLIWKEK